MISAKKKRSSAAYALIQQQATCLTSQGAYYWSKSKEIEVLIKFGENPADLVLSGEAEPFHVVFGRMRSSSGASIPDLGLFILGSTQISLDYRMGMDWNQAAIEGLFDLILSLKCLAPNQKYSILGMCSTKMTSCCLLLRCGKPLTRQSGEIANDTFIFIHGYESAPNTSTLTLASEPRANTLNWKNHD